MTATEAERIDSMTKCLSRLERHALALHYAEGLTPAEIGLVLDQPQCRIEDILADLRERVRRVIFGATNASLAHTA